MGIINRKSKPKKVNITRLRKYLKNKINDKLGTDTK